MVPMLKMAIDEALATYAVPARPKARALDIGCGRQPFRTSLQDIGYQYVGMDVHQNPEQTVFHFGAIDQPLPDSLAHETFDLLLVTEVLEHVADWSAAFQNFAALLSTDGIILITSPFIYPLHEIPYDFWRPTLHAIKFFADREGLEQLCSRSVGAPADVLGTVLAACHIMPVSNTPLSRITSKAFNLFRKIALRSLRRKRWSSRIRIEGEMYLSNVSVLRKRAN